MEIPAEARDSARESALRTLTSAAKSRAELANTLERRGYPASVVEPLLDRLTEVGLLDDAALAQALVRTRLTQRSQARRAIAAELCKRGIPESVATEALTQVDDLAERDAARALAAAALRRSVGLDRQRRIRRAVATVCRRGHDPELAYEVVRQAIDAEGRMHP